MRIQGIYKIINLVNGKIYVGLSKNIKRRFSSHKSAFKRFIENGSNLTRANVHLLNSVAKYGLSNFLFDIIEVVDNPNDLLSRESFWIEQLNTLDRDFGYNMQKDNGITIEYSKEVRKKASDRIKKQWKDGKRTKQSGKLKQWFKDNPEQSLVKSKLLTKTLTKYEYYIYKDDNLIEVCGYKKLVELGFKNANVNFSRLKSDTCNCKKHKIVRMKI